MTVGFGTLFLRKCITLTQKTTRSRYNDHSGSGVGYVEGRSLRRNQISKSHFDITIQQSDLPKSELKWPVCLNGRSAKWKRISAVHANNPRGPPLANYQIAVVTCCCDVLL
ncbi:unnamed protein product [Ectocarpus sp. 8 AP-2014]